MGVGDVIGGMAAVGVVVLIGLSLTEDDSPEALTVEPSETILAPGSSDSTTTIQPTTSVTDEVTEGSEAAPSSTAEDSTTDDSTTTTSPSSTTTSTTSPATTTTSPPSTTTTYPPEFVPFIVVQVVNGGGGPGSAADTTEELRADGFDPVSPNDAVVLLDATTILYAPGWRSEALRVNDVIGALPENVREATAEDPNWAEFGASGDLDVLVVIGPS